MIKYIRNFLSLILFGHYHTWGKWKKRSFLYQERYCETCGKCQEKYV